MTVLDDVQYDMISLTNQRHKTKHLGDMRA